MLHCSEECTMIDIQDRAYCPVLEEIGEYTGNLRKDRHGKRSEMADDRCGRSGRVYEDVLRLIAIRQGSRRCLTGKGSRS